MSMTSMTVISQLDETNRFNIAIQSSKENKKNYKQNWNPYSCPYVHAKITFT